MKHKLNWKERADRFAELVGSIQLEYGWIGACVRVTPNQRPLTQPSPFAHTIHCLNFLGEAEKVFSFFRFFYFIFLPSTFLTRQDNKVTEENNQHNDPRRKERERERQGKSGRTCRLSISTRERTATFLLTMDNIKSALSLVELFVFCSVVVALSSLPSLYEHC